ncbi:5-dehydro-4-deoxy-D-glucuronate isomerase [Paracoccus sp. TK19116]|uniref:4-deoxy-L-threo-5-hexosulose-uronate ketol-isomerase n=1 Tax=Paracoccus albicereus TaxID=2922394 RepID=A0ABT1MP43_9RHOB|nr:5-dehydro-4-deoxy-D-glucuronate isomerase [Paracoccus albicereus]MCQ0970064.1 5-dehydro-4-deoxy-D-glucuronate isomerase [Paracoccus albicereus]
MMDVRYGAGPGEIDHMGTDRLRAEFMVEGLFRPGELRMTYTHLDRMIVGGAVPTDQPLRFVDGADVGTELFFTAREAGIANLGGPGWAEVDGQRMTVAGRDCLYIGRGSRSVTLGSDDPAKPARFYLNSVPAGADHPTRVVTRAESKQISFGERDRGNYRELRMYIHPEVGPSCLLLMGITDVPQGQIWNTQPPHLHERRMEAYCYTDLAPEDRVFHFMGRPDNTRHLVVQNGDVVLSPAWSIHMGAGTGPYAFVWGMTGENQAYGDVDPVPVSALR